MGKPTGFLDHDREKAAYRDAEERLRDWKMVQENFSNEQARTQGARCMDCGIPFCNEGCPLGNVIPDWNDLVYQDKWEDALARLHSTNNFPEFTGMVCPAPCEGACVLEITDPAVTIKNIEMAIIDHGFEEGWVKPCPPASRTGKRVAIIGSGPAGLAAAQQLARAGHAVTVFERDSRIGGLLRYGIPDFKMEKWTIDRRLEQMEAEGVEFRPNANVGKEIDAGDLLKEYDALCLTGGATLPRDLQVPGRELTGTYFAMEFLPLQNKRNAGDEIPDAQFISAKGKRVIILGGGDTGADCLGTVHRQGAKSVIQMEIMPEPPEYRPTETPWPTYPNIYRVSGAHEEGGEREFSVQTTRLSGGSGALQKLHGNEVEFAREDGRMVMKEIPGTEFEERVDLLLLAMGFLGPERYMLDQLGVEVNDRGNVVCDRDKTTSVPGVFTAGDMTRGQSLIVWAIQEGRTAARGIDRYLMGETALPGN